MLHCHIMNIQIVETVRVDAVMRTQPNDTILDLDIVRVRHVRSKVGRSLTRNERLRANLNNAKPTLLMMKDLVHLHLVPVEIDRHIVRLDGETSEETHRVRTNEGAACAHVVSLLLLAWVPHIGRVRIRVIAAVHLELNILHQAINARLQNTIRAIRKISGVHLHHSVWRLQVGIVHIRRHPRTRLHHARALRLVTHAVLSLGTDARHRIVRGSDTVVVRRVHRSIRVRVHMCAQSAHGLIRHRRQTLVTLE
mmetsp:Transcript_26979/g.44253  ORF Transcript_26979/g.44253 Transcript_26979/m.44253 type:complete len:252 (+) Transcript_26979:2260-3015(+)